MVRKDTQVAQLEVKMHNSPTEKREEMMLADAQNDCDANSNATTKTMASISEDQNIHTIW